MDTQKKIGVDEAKKIIINDLVGKIQFIDSEVDRLSKKVEDLENEKYDIISMLESFEEFYGINILGSVNSNDAYDKNSGWLEKIVFVLNKKRHCLATYEIIQELNELDTELALKDREMVRKSVAGAISFQTKAGKLSRYELDGRLYVGLPKWFDGETVKEEYKHKMKVLATIKI